MAMRRSDPRPPEAWWSEADREWVFGDRDEVGRLTGRVRYWDADGRFICESEHVAGRPHGIFRRFDHPGGELSQEGRYTDGRIDGVRRIHRPSTPVAEPARAGYGTGGPWRDAAESVRVYECVYDDGDLIGTLYRDAAGVEIDQAGKPVPPRPDGVATTASHVRGGDSGGWLFMRRRGEDGEGALETRQWWPDGILQHEWAPDGTERRYYRDGALWSEGRRASRDGRRARHGTWRYYDAQGLPRRESAYDSSVGYGVERTRTWHRTPEEADGRGVTRSGPVEDDVETGLWQVHDATGTLVREVGLGRLWGNVELLATPAAADLPYTAAELRAVLADADADDPDGAAAQLARIRLAAHEGAAVLALLTGDERPWPTIAAEGDHWYRGQPASPLTSQSSLAQVIHAVRWGEPAGPTLAELARNLFHGGHPHAALDVIDAALLLGDEAEGHRTRAVLLRALGRDADAVTSGPDHVDEPAARLLLAIRARPADDGPRLAYGELVAASHPAHARLIAAQCGGDTDDEHTAVAAYLATLPEEVREALIGHPERGFAPTITDVPAETFLRHHDALFRAAPEDDHLELQGARDDLAEIALLPALGRYRTLRVYDSYLGGDCAAQLARSPYLRQLECLGLPDTCLDDDDLTALLTSHSYPRLRVLDVSASRYSEQDWTTAGLAALPDAVFAPYLETLVLRRSSYDLDDGVVTFLRALPRLTDLTLDGHLLGDGVLTGLSELPNRFAALDLTGNFTPDGVSALTHSTVTSRLERLSLKNGGDSCPAAMLALLRGPQIGALRMLCLSGGFADESRTPPEVGHAFVESVVTRSLESLELPGGRLGSDGAAGLAAAPFERLRRLGLQHNGIGDEGAAAVARTPTLATLRWLDLSSNDIGDAGALALAESPHLAGLEFLHLNHARLGARSTDALKERFGDRVWFR